MLVRFGRFEVDLAARSLCSSEGALLLRRKAFDVLAAIVEKPNCVVTKGEIIARAWPNADASDESLARCVSDIRAVLGDEGRNLIKTVPGVGYVLSGTAPLSDGATHEQALVGRPTVAVLPFAALGDVRGITDISESVAEEITIELCRFSNLAVIASHSSFRFKDGHTDVREVGRLLGADFVVEGTVRREQQRLHLTARLTHAASGKHLWGSRFLESLDDVAKVQSDIARTVAGMTGAHISNAEVDRRWAPYRMKGQAYDLYIEASRLVRAWYSTYRDIENLYKARGLFEKVIEAAPREARAYAGLASTFFSTFLFKHDGDFRDPAILERIKDLCRMAIEHDPHLPEAYGHLGHVFLHEGDHDSALAAHRRSHAINPNRCDFRHATALVFSGEHDEAIDISRTGMRLDPFHSPVASGWLGAALYFKRDYPAALSSLLEATNRAARWRGGLLFLAATYEQLGEADKARRVAKQVIELEPDWTIEGTGKAINRFRRTEDDEHFFGALKRAGLQ